MVLSEPAHMPLLPKDDEQRAVANKTPRVGSPFRIITPFGWAITLVHHMVD